MSKMTRQDLQTKTRPQLAALFHEASLRLNAAPETSRDLADAGILLGMILVELASRGPSP